MKLIMENWNKFLKEEIDPRIQNQIDKLLRGGMMKKHLGIVITHEGENSVGFQYAEINPETGNFTFLKKDPIFPGVIKIRKANKESDGPCYDGWIIASSYSRGGMGPLLYEVAIEWASRNNPEGGLMPDRRTVSPDAIAVWEKFNKRTDIKIRQLDTNHPGDQISRGEKVKHLQLTADKPKDDCAQWMAAGKYGYETDPEGKTGWVSSALSKIYYKDTTEIINALGDRLIEV